MTLSVFDLFKIGIGPSSSHTVGPMWAAHRFLTHLADTCNLEAVARVRIDLYGSLSATGKGHCTDKAVLLGLLGEKPDTVDPDSVDPAIAQIRTTRQLRLGGKQAIQFCEPQDLLFHEECLPGHPNGLQFTAFAADGTSLLHETYYSVGGGFVVQEGESPQANLATPVALPYEFNSAAELLRHGKRTGLRIADLVRANERTLHDDPTIDARLDQIWQTMEQCIERGCRQEGILPGGLNVKRRAARLFHTLQAQSKTAAPDPLTVLDWVSLFALAVNEENAAGSRVVTAPTNGAAGVIPAVLAYYRRFVPGPSDEGTRTFLITAAAIGMLYKKNASLSAAEVGCQGEVGVACSMAAAGLAAVLGGTNEQIENAAEIGMEHNLGLTCDPVGGLVQVPCIERNTMGATKALNAARLAVLHGDGTHRISLDHVIATMQRTGQDMQDKYKETARGGLAVNLVEC